MFRRLFIIFSIILFLAAGFSARAYYNPGKPAGFVNDYTGTLSSEQVSALNSKLSNFNATTTNEVSVVIIKSLAGDTIENFANKLFTDWGIGTKKQDNGVLLLVATDDHQMRIETGYGLEGALPDATANQIITKTLTPAFKNGDYYGGIDQATDQIIAATKGEYSAAADAGATDSVPGFLKNLDFNTIFFIILILFYTLSALWRWLAKSKSWWQGGVLGGAIGLIIALIFFRVLLFLIILPLAIGFFGLLFDFLVSRVLPPPVKTKGGRNNFWFFGGGPGGFGGSGGGGFGGFGGGMSGGGGASGRW